MIWAQQFRIVDGALGVMFQEGELTQVFKVIIPIHCYEELIKFTHATTFTCISYTGQQQGVARGHSGGYGRRSLQ